MPRYESIVVVGSSGAGKTTLVNGLRTEEFAEVISIPLRYITRPERLGDDLTENAHIGRDEFMKKVEAGEVYPYWQRELDGGRIEQYGFAADDSKKLKVYSANNAFLRDSNPSLDDALKCALVVIASSDDSERAMRLAERSPDMSAGERSVRLSDLGADLLNVSNSILIDTKDLSPEQGQEKLQSIARAVLRGGIEMSNENIVAKGKIFELVQLKQDDGRVFEVARRAPGVRLIIADKANKKVLLTKEYRTELDEWDYRLPGGKVFDSLDEFEAFRASGEDMVEAAKHQAVNEGQQEAGVEIGSLELFKKSILGATVEWDLYVFEATSWQLSVHGQELEVGEKIEADNWAAYDEAKRMILDGNMQEERIALILLQWLEAQS